MLKGRFAPRVMLPTAEEITMNLGSALARSSAYVAWKRTRGPLVLTCGDE